MKKFAITENVNDWLIYWPIDSFHSFNDKCTNWLIDSLFQNKYVASYILGPKDHIYKYNFVPVLVATVYRSHIL